MNYSYVSFTRHNGRRFRVVLRRLRYLSPRELNYFDMHSYDKPRMNLNSQSTRERIQCNQIKAGRALGHVRIEVELLHQPHIPRIALYGPSSGDLSFLLRR